MGQFRSPLSIRMAINVSLNRIFQRLSFLVYLYPRFFPRCPLPATRSFFNGFISFSPQPCPRALNSDALIYSAEEPRINKHFTLHEIEPHNSSKFSHRIDSPPVQTSPRLSLSLSLSLASSLSHSAPKEAYSWMKVIKNAAEANRTRSTSYNQTVGIGKVIKMISTGAMDSLVTRRR